MKGDINMSVTASHRLFISSRCSQTIFTQRLQLARVALAKGWDVQFGGDVAPGGYEKCLNRAGFQFHPLPVNQKSISPIGILRLILAYRKILREEKPDIFHAFTIKPHIGGLLGAKLAGVKVRIATVAGLGHIFISSSTLVKHFAIFLLKFSLFFAHVVIFYNQSDRDEYVRRKIIPYRKTRIIKGSGIDTNKFGLTALPDTNVLRFVFVGRLLAEKGVLDLFDAMRIVKTQCPDTELHLVGDCDPQNPSAVSRELILSLAEEGLFIWHGMLSDVRPIIENSHVVILPSYREGIPLALMEGAAMGRGLIGADVPGCQDVIVQGVTGLLIPPRNPKRLAEAMITLASDRLRLARMGLTARQDVVTRFDTQVVNSQVIELYEEYLENA